MTFARAEGGPATEVRVELARVVDRLRTMTAARLARPCPAGDAPPGVRGDAAVGATGVPAEGAGGLSAADVGHALAQRLADRGRELEGGPARRVPRLGDLAVGDQVAVTGHDLLAAAATASDGRTAERLLQEAALDLRAVRLAL